MSSAIKELYGQLLRQELYNNIHATAMRGYCVNNKCCSDWAPTIVYRISIPIKKCQGQRDLLNLALCPDCKIIIINYVFKYTLESPQYEEGLIECSEDPVSSVIKWIENARNERNLKSASAVSEEEEEEADEEEEEFM